MQSIDGLLTKYEFSFVSSVPSNLLCTICKRVLVQANYGACGCRFCAQCIKDYLGTDEKKCPSNSDEFCSSIGLRWSKNVFVDIAANRDVAALVAKCPHKHCMHTCSLIRMAEHLQTCERLSVSCVFSDIGCQNKDLLTENIREHVSVEIIEHLRLLLDFVKNLENETLMRISEINGQLDILLKDSRETREKMELFINKSLANDEAIQNVKSHVTQSQRDITSIKSEIVNIQNNSVDKIRLMEEKIVKLEEKINVTQQQVVVRNIVQPKPYKRSSETQWDFLWSIEGITADSADDFFHSDPFYTHYGYKVSLRLLIKNSGLFMWFRLLKGEGDSMLIWPFRHNITVSILDHDSKDKLISGQQCYSDQKGNKNDYNQPQTDWNYWIYCLSRKVTINKILEWVEDNLLLIGFRTDLPDE